jgi:hypothetical protein
LSRNCTPATPLLSEATAETVTTPETVEFAAGALIETVGGVVSGGGIGSVDALTFDEYSE